MNRTSLVLAGMAAFALNTAAFANGGGYSFGVRFTGSLAPFQATGVDQVRIVEEKLDIVLRRTEAAVEVRYLMKNFAEQPVSVRFGFPVEANFAEYDHSPEDRQQRASKLNESIQQLKGYTVTAGGQPVPSKLVVEPFATGKIKPFPGSKALKDIIGWMVSEVTFPAGEPLALEIRYAADYRGDETSVSDDGNVSNLSFLYRLSTGAVWNGPIEQGTVTMRADGIPADEVAILAPKERFKRTGEAWTWTFTNLEPTLADDIKIDAIPGYSTMWGYGQREEGTRDYMERRGAWGRGHQQFKATASSALAATESRSYGPGNLANPPPVATTWAEGVEGNGIGEWVELAPIKPSPLLALAIGSGLRRLFTQNGRPSRVEILLNDEHRFAASLGDKPDQQIVPILGYSKRVAKLRITILDVYPGSRYQDTCISSVVLYDRLPTKPEVSHAR